ncbi:MAG: 30S ribosomal protein S20 [Planctomycetota bacterium]
MANLASAKKRNRQNERNRIRNRARRALIKTEKRRFFDALQGGKMDEARELLRGLSKQLDQTAAKGTIHKRTAARQKSRLTRRLNAVAA